MTPKLVIDSYTISDNHPPYIIAEMSGNHNGKIDRAFKLIELAKKSGANAVKLQTYTPDTMTIDHDSLDFRVKGGLWDGNTLYELYEKAYTPWDWHKELFLKGKEIGITIFSTPFDNSAVEFLETLGAPAYKIASFENSDLPLIEKVASTKKPMIISTGMANLNEIKEAVETAHNGGCEQLALLHCVSGYPTSAEESNLKTIIDLKKRFNLVIGLSDHTLSNVTSISSISLGARIIEKHFTLDRNDGGPDASFSLEKNELLTLVQDCRDAYNSIGLINYNRTKSEEQSSVFRRSIYIVKDIRKGEIFNNENLRIIRPGYGLPPKLFRKILGKKASRDLSRGTAMKNDYFI